jgi:hypothetical protein
MRTPRRIAVSVSACALVLPLLLATAAPAAAATTRVVDDDMVDCPAATYTTIQDAVNAAAAGDTIEVCAGAYPEAALGPLTINKTLTLKGAQVGVDARSRAGDESVIADSQGTSIAASDVVIDGFTVQNSTNPAFTGYGLWINPGKDGTQIVNNIIENNIVGIGLANAGATQAVIEHNLIRNNNRSGGASGSGIYTDQYVGGSTVRNVLIDENAFIGNDNAALDISNEDFSGGVFGLEVSSNLSDGNGRAFFLLNTHDSAFDGNTIRNSTFVGSADLRIYDADSNLLFTNNDLSAGAGHAARLTAFTSPNSNIDFHYNNFENYASTGMTAESGSHEGPVDAECNWWNSPTGPTAVGNPGGTGEEAVGDIDYNPWLLGRAPGGACRGGVQSTPGKVTGGGQLPGTDPRFSAAGDLLTAPAIVPSAANPTAQATFGFVVSCCRLKGNLEYNDHAADVRIKVRSIDGLFIEDGTCGANTHATFVGTATVYRSNGTVNESFTVEVDDCGEPGTLDTFSITTDTYSNGPSVLLGGNIQIHRS